MIEWGDIAFFLAFIGFGLLTYACWLRMVNRAGH